MIKKYGMQFSYGTVQAALVWRKPFIVEQICLNGEIPAEAEPTANNPAALDFIRRLQSFTSDGQDEVCENELDLDQLTAFQRQVLLSLRRKVPRGRVTTYGQLAVLAGHPGAAQAVGQVMRRNPLPLVLPCHRVLGRNGSPGGFQGGLEQKSQLLSMEGYALNID